MMFFNPFETGLATNTAGSFLFSTNAGDIPKSAAVAVGGGGDHQLWSQLAASVVSAATATNSADSCSFVTTPNFAKNLALGIDPTIMLPPPDSALPSIGAQGTASAFTPCSGNSTSTIDLLSQFAAHRDHDALYGAATSADDVKQPTVTLLPTAEENVEPSRKHPPTTDCLGCNETINDKTFIHIGENSWHERCVRCSVCAQLLDNQPSCFTRNGVLYCRQDYFRKFSRHCERCGDIIGAGEMIIHATPAHIFHISCFTCVICGWSLSTGETYFLGQNGSLICQRHYNNIENDNCGEKLAEKKDNGRPDELDDGRLEGPSTISHDDSVGYINPTASTTSTTSFGVDHDDLSSADSNGAAGNGHRNKAKRMRTSFKHQQLRMMKGYFTINHNPDAKDLKQLAVKTGLSKRVLQVWFQNARAKFRRNQQNHRIDSMLPRCSGANGGGGSGDGSPASAITYAMELQMLSNPIDMNNFRYGSSSISGRTSISPTDSTTMFEVLADGDSASSVGGVAIGTASDNDYALRPQFLPSQSQSSTNDVNIVML